MAAVAGQGGKRQHGHRRAVVAALASVTGLLSSVAADAAPPIRISTDNVVPACVTPARLMAFLATRNPSPAARFRDIAASYRRHGEAWRVRWDYAFFQMAIETNFLKFRRGDGSFGDVKERQNNFAGLGTTGGGVPGDSYPDVSTGVLAQVQHLVAYSGERVAAPVGPRTRLTQDDVVSASLRIARSRPVTFGDLAGRWAVDRKYARSINAIATLFANQYCPGVDITRAIPATSIAARGATPPRPVIAAATPRPALRPTAHVGTGPSVRPALRPAFGAQAAGPARAQARQSSPQPASSASASPTCSVNVASFGGTRTVLIRNDQSDGGTELTALGVHSGFERTMAESFIRQYAPGGRKISQFDSRAAALRQAYAMCAPAARTATSIR